MRLKMLGETSWQLKVESRRHPDHQVALGRAIKCAGYERSQLTIDIDKCFVP
jgi:hypothetical protein